MADNPNIPDYARNALAGIVLTVNPDNTANPPETFAGRLTVYSGALWLCGASEWRQLRGSDGAVIFNDAVNATTGTPTAGVLIYDAAGHMYLGTGAAWKQLAEVA